jgi:choice-of-anchor A domain-containing protein
LELGPNSVSINGPPGGIQGNVCIAPRGKLAISGGEFVTGNIELGPGATFAKSGPGTIGGTVVSNVDLSADIAQALAASSFAASLPCTQHFTQLNTSTTITGTVGTNVICVGSVVLNTATITLTGPAGAKFVLNVTGKFVLNGTSHIVAGGGVLPRDILYNIIGTGEDVAFTGGGGGTTCCNSSVDGTLLAISRKINLSPGLVNGQVISAQNISIVSGSSVRCPATPCTPVSVPNTVTINAEIAVSQSNTNINPACVLNINGQPITASSRCSALVECNK